MSYSKANKNDQPSRSTNRKPPAIKDQLTPATSTPSRLPGTLHPASSATPPPKTRQPSTAPARKPSAATKPTPSLKRPSPQQTPQRKFSATPTPSHLSPNQPRKASVTPKSPSARKTSATPKPSHLTPPGRNAYTVLNSAPSQATQPLKPSPRKASATPKLPSPPKPDWKAPPGKRCSFTSSPTQIPSPVFVFSVRKDASASLEPSSLVGSGIGGLCTPVPAQRRRRGGVMGSSPLVCEVSGEEDVLEGSGRKGMEEVKELGLRLLFNDPFLSTLGSASGTISAVSGLPVSPRVKPITDALSPTSPTSPRPRIYTPTSTATTPTFATALSPIATNSKHQQQAGDAEEQTPKRDSLSPNLGPTTVTPPSRLTFPSTATPRSQSSRIPHLKYRHLSPLSTLPPSPSSTHPYTGNAHITPSCTVGALTHRLACGHLVLTIMPEVCGVNCIHPKDVRSNSSQEAGGKKGGGEVRREKSEQERVTRERQGNGWERAWRERIARKREHTEQGFVGNIRNLDAEWGCPCCVMVGEQGKRRRCVAILAAEHR